MMNVAGSDVVVFAYAYFLFILAHPLRVREGMGMYINTIIIIILFFYLLAWVGSLFLGWG